MENFKPDNVQEINRRVEEMIFAAELLDEFKYGDKWNRALSSMKRIFDKTFLVKNEMCWDKLFSGYGLFMESITR
jgi:hypothetical protein